MFNKIKENVTKHEDPSMTGFQNNMIRYWRYCDGGMQLLNEFKNVAVILLAGYYVLKLLNPWLLVVGFVAAILLFTFIGWYRVHKMDRVIEWLNIKFSTYYGFSAYNIQKETLEELKSIHELLNKQSNTYDYERRK